MKHVAYITVAEAANLTGRRAVTIRWWARNRKVRRYKSGNTWLVLRLDVLAYEGERRRGGGRR
jgi:excisionase family DNA binding protein